jgi:hypothetical protein
VLPKRFYTTVAALALYLVEVNAILLGIGHGYPADVSERRWMLAIIPDIGKQKNREVNQALHGKH